MLSCCCVVEVLSSDGGKNGSDEIPLCFGASHKGILMVGELVLLEFHCGLVQTAGEF